MFSSNGSQVSGSSARFIEEVFSTYIYSGQNSNQQIVNNIDTQYPAKALVWIKQRTSSGSGADMRHILGYNGFGTNLQLGPDSTLGLTGGQDSGGINAYNTNGFTAKYAWNANEAGATYASWTFKTNPKFFDIATFTQASGSTTTFSHDLGSAPGCMFIKTTGVNNFWLVYHRSLGNNQYIILNNTGVAQSYSGGFSVSSTSVTINNALLAATGNIFVAFCFAHDAGGFGLTGAENMISCGTVTGNGTTPNTVVSLGYEPQWILLKDYVNGGSWYIIDNMRGFPVTGGTHPVLLPNSSGAEATGFNRAHPQPTGFNLGNNDANTYLYIAIRRGPMQIPTDATKVFSPLNNSNSTGTQNTTGFPVDLQIWNLTTGYQATVQDRLRGVSTTSTQTSVPELVIPYTYAEYLNAFQVRNWNMTGFETPTAVNGSNVIWWNFRRAPSFFDIVCYTGNNVDTNYYDGSP